MSVESLVQSLQKAEIEGSIAPELMFKLAERNQLELPYESVTDLRETY